MKHLRKRIEKREIVEVEYVQCDWCQKVFDDENRDTYKDTELDITYQDVDPEFKLEYTVAQSDGYDWVDTVGFKVEDLCPTCAMKLKGLMIEAGINVTDINRY